MTDLKNKNGVLKDSAPSVIDAKSGNVTIRSGDSTVLKGVDAASFLTSKVVTQIPTSEWNTSSPAVADGDLIRFTKTVPITMQINSAVLSFKGLESVNIPPVIILNGPITGICTLMINKFDENDPLNSYLDITNHCQNIIFKFNEGTCGNFLYKGVKYQVKAHDANSLTLNYMSFGKLLEIAKLMYEESSKDPSTITIPYEEITKILGIDSNLNGQQSVGSINQKMQAILAIYEGATKTGDVLQISLDKLSKESVADIVSLVSNDHSASGAIKPENCSAHEPAFAEHFVQSKDDDVKTTGDGLEESSN